MSHNFSTKSVPFQVAWVGKNEEDLKAAKVDYRMHMYPGTNHGFHNDSTARYDEENAALAWERTLAFFKKHLG